MRKSAGKYLVAGTATVAEQGNFYGQAIIRWEEEGGEILEKPILFCEQFDTADEAVSAIGQIALRVE